MGNVIIGHVEIVANLFANCGEKGLENSIIILTRL